MKIWKHGESPPADYLDPNPLKFLTVAKDTVFIFRALVDKGSAGLIDKVKLESVDEKKVFTQVVKARMDKAFKNSRAKEKLAPFLG